MSSDSEEKLNKLIGNESKIIKSILPIKNTFNEKIPQNIALKKLNFKKKPKLLLLFFGFVRAYKGLDLIFNALANLKNMDIKLLIAGECYKDKNKYKKLIDKNNLSNSIIWHNKYILDSEINIYFSASDAIILPYKKMSQSGIVPLAYNYNKLIIASDLMSFKEHIVNNETGYLFKKNNPISLKNTLEDVYYNHNFKLSSDLIEDHKKKYTNQNLINDISSLLKL
jgi:glycosyltransferase involved in cell wall biosynthesis